MSEEMNVYDIGPNREVDDDVSYEDYSMNYRGDFALQVSTCKNMDKLLAHFHKNENYPYYYLGIAKRVAICKCPITEKEEWYNGERCLKVENPVKGSTITVELQVKDKVYSREFIFMGWVKTPVHEWLMSKGNTFQLEQKFINKLLPKDKRYLKIAR
jgi:hypothetical protein